MKPKNLIALLVMTTANCLSASENLLTKAEIKAYPYQDQANRFSDGSFSTWWGSYTAENASGTFTLTFAESIQFNAVTLNGKNMSAGYIELSEDGKTWTRLDEFNNSGAPNLLTYYSKQLQEANLMRLKVLGSERRQAIQIADLRIFVMDVPYNKAFGSKIIEDGEDLNWRFPATLYVDGDTKNAVTHYSKYSGSVITLELAKVEELSKLTLFSERGFDSIMLSISTDGKTWKEVGANITPNKLQEIEFPKVNAKFVKLNVRGKSSARPQEIVLE